MRKNLFTISLLSIVALGVGVLTSCSNDAPSTNLGGVEIPLSSKKENTFQATTSVSLLNSITESSALSRASQLKLGKDFKNQESPTSTDFKEILPQLELMMNNGFDIKSEIESVETTIGDTTYSVKETISYKDFNNQEVTYSLVYNVKEYEEKDDDEIEKYTLMDGYVLLEENEYSFRSLMKSEEEHDENEVERNFKINLENNSYIFVESSLENEGDETEEEYEYTYVENGRKKMEYSIEIEKEGFKDSIEIEENEKEYEVKRISKDGKTYFLVQIKEGKNYKDYLSYEKVLNDDGSVSYIETTFTK